MKKKKFDLHKTMKDFSRQVFDVRPTKVLKNKKNKLVDKEVRKEIDKYIKGEI